MINYAPSYHHFEAGPNCLQDVVTSSPHHYALYHLRPRLHVPEPPALPELAEEAHKPGINHQIRDLMTAQVLGLCLKCTVSSRTSRYNKKYRNPKIYIKHTCRITRPWCSNEFQNITKRHHRRSRSIFPSIYRSQVKNNVSSNREIV